jgi:ribosomal protein L16 Arg81 hydroxylase
VPQDGVATLDHVLESHEADGAAMGTASVGRHWDEREHFILTVELKHGRMNIAAEAGNDAQRPDQARSMKRRLRSWIWPAW